MLVLWLVASGRSAVAARLCFCQPGDKQLAGMLAGKLFEVMADRHCCCELSDLSHRARWRRRAENTFFWAVVVMLVLT
jgi:hypothetical protein